MTRTLILIIYFSFSLKLAGQKTIPKLYLFFVRQADSLWKKKEYSKSAYAYSSAFMTLENKGRIYDRYKAARAWSLSNVPDSAFDCLQRIIKPKYFTDYGMLISQKDFTVLHNDKRWQPLLDTLKLNHDTKKGIAKNFPSTTITVKNTLDSTVSLYYLRTEVDEIHYLDLKPMETQFQQSYLSDSWVIRRKYDNKQVLKFTVRRRYQEFETKNKRHKRKS